MWFIDILLTVLFVRPTGKGLPTRVTIALSAIVLLGTVLAIVSQSSLG